MDRPLAALDQIAGTLARMSASSQADNPYEMTRAELDAFLAEPQFAAISTVRRDGSPVAGVFGFEWDGEFLYLSVRSTRLIVKRLARDPRICITAFNRTYPPKWVVIQGTAESIEPPDEETERRMMLRFMAPDSPVQTMADLDLDEFWKNYTTVGRVFYRIRPHTILSEDGAKWGDHEGVAGAGVSDELARERGDLGTAG